MLPPGSPCYPPTRTLPALLLAFAEARCGRHETRSAGRIESLGGSEAHAPEHDDEAYGGPEDGAPTPVVVRGDSSGEGFDVFATWAQQGLDNGRVALARGHDEPSLFFAWRVWINRSIERAGKQQRSREAHREKQEQSLERDPWHTKKNTSTAARRRQRRNGASCHPSPP